MTIPPFSGRRGLILVTLMFSAGLVAGGQTALSPLRDKTLVAWVSPANLTQRGGSVLTVDDQRSHFDGIIFGEISARKWMAGSDFYARSKQDQGSAPDETAEPGTLVQIAIVYQDKQITVYRKGKEYSRHTMERPQSFGAGSAVVIGLRHLEATDRACFAGVIDDARIYNIALSAEQIAALKPKQLSEPKPVAWWNFANGKAEDAMGTFPAASLVGKAIIAHGQLALDGNESFMVTPPAAALPKAAEGANRYDSPIHFRPKVGALADTIPFFWKGQYHIFYLRGGIGKVPWEHIVSTDLIHWRELPTALRPDGAPDGPDGMNMFTGSVTEHNGTFHIFYTGDNNRNTNGAEFICHATSPDLITWSKHPRQAFRADGVTYKNSDFRDPDVFWNEADQAFWMILCARAAGSGRPVQGVARSTDLTSWRQVEPLTYDPPLGQGTSECPDLFRIGNTWYIIHSPSAGTTDMRYASDIRGPYRLPPTPTIDTPILYAAKRMFDGRRHILTGWIRDLNGERDGGGGRWGGDQSVPREVYAGAHGQLLFRPAPEALAAFPVVAADSRRLAPSTARPSSLPAPDNYLLECRVQLSGKSEFTLSMREQAGPGTGYRLVLRPAQNEAEIAGDKFSYRRRVDLDYSKPMTIRAFVQGSIIECFIADAYAFSCRAYDARSGPLSLLAQDEESKALDWIIKVPEAVQAAKPKRE